MSLLFQLHMYVCEIYNFKYFVLYVQNIIRYEVVSRDEKRGQGGSSSEESFNSEDEADKVKLLPAPERENLENMDEETRYKAILQVRRIFNCCKTICFVMNMLCNDFRKHKWKTTSTQQRTSKIRPIITILRTVSTKV